MSDEIWDNLFPPQNTQKQPVICDIQLQELNKEIAYHEASHYVFMIMALKYFDCFTPINFITSCASKLGEGNYNAVNGFGPAGISDVEMSTIDPKEDSLKIREFYEKDRKRVVVKLLTLIAGYASYQVFKGSKSEFYIGVPNDNSSQDNSDSKELQYFTTELVIESQFSHGVSDFVEILKKLRIYYNINGNSEKTEVVNFLKADAQRLMKLKRIGRCIRFVAKELFDNNCNKIEGEKLIKIQKKIGREIKKIPLLEICRKLDEEIYSIRNNTNS